MKLMNRHFLLLLLLAGFFLGTPLHTQAQRRTNKKRTAPKTVEQFPTGYAYLRAVTSDIAAVPTDISWIYLGRDGTIIKDPKYGVDPVDIIQEKKHNAGKTGRYSVNDGKMFITWENGKTAEWKVDYQNGELVSIDGAPVRRQSPMPNNYRLAGQFSAASILPNVSSSTTIVFSKDGSFSQSSFGGVSTASGSAVSQEMSDGKYTITGNTLRLNYEDGKKAVFMIALWTMNNGKQHLVINTGSFPQE